jgi:alpha-tubulin suppressor-like RCC1 family protein
MLAISLRRVELGAVHRCARVSGIPWLACSLLVALGAPACERPTAPVALVYADRPVVVSASSEGWRSVSVGGAHNCGIRVDDRLFCWGSNASGQLGVASARGQCLKTTASCEASPRSVALAPRIRQVSTGDRHTCAVALDGALFCWGENIVFQAGVEALTFVRVPTPVAATMRFNQVSAGGTHTCAVRTNGVVYCWGEGRLGALGRGDTVSSVIPQPVASDQRFEQVSAGGWRSCAVSTTAELWCWGAEWESGQQATDIFHERLLPHRVNGAPPLRTVSVSGTMICGIALDGAALCWESNYFGQLGTGALEGTTMPSRVAVGEPMRTVSAGAIQGCGLTEEGRALCWGNDSFGQLGIPRTGELCGVLECRRTPAAVFGGLRFTSVSTGLGVHSCGVTTATAVVCWGLGNEGQLGDGWLRDRQSLPVGVLAPTP